MSGRWMMFVDGENFTIRAEKAAKKNDAVLEEFAGPYVGGGIYIPGVCFWPKGLAPFNCGWWSSTRYQPGTTAVRCHYYTSIQGDSAKISDVRDQLQSIHFSADVFKKPQGSPSKGVDIALTRDLLTNAFLDNYDIAVIVTGDADFIPVIQEIRRLGKYVILAFLSETHGLSPDLRREVDAFVSLDRCVNAKPKR